MDRLLRALGSVTLVIEVAVAVGLVVLAALVIITFGLELADAVTHDIRLEAGEFNALISTVLEVFILVELFRIAVAYMKHQNVIPTVLEAALVAVARKFVVFEGSPNYLEYALGMSALLIAVAVSWWLLQRSNACELHE